jgi:type I restriction enzyme S subunit
VIEDLKPYSETKDSGLAWLGDIPAHWEIKRNGSLFQQRIAVGEPDWPILEVSLRTGVRIREFGSSKRKQVMSDKAKYKCATKGDFVYNMMRMWQGAAGIAPVDGLVSPAYVVAKPLPHTNPAYFASLFRTDDYLAEIDAFSRGIVKDRNRLYWDQFKQIPTPCPPPEEQAAIARFLAWATNRLDRAIGAKRRIIALLQEQKQAIIHRAVTRGLDPSVPLKDSGIPWLGEIPVDWEVRRLKDVATVQTGITLGKDYGLVSTTLYPYLRVANVQSDRLDLRNVKYVAVPEVEAKRSSLFSGDVLMTEGGDIDKLGRGCLWSGEVASCLHQNHVFAVRCGARLIPGFLVALMGSTHGRSYFQTTAKQTTNLASTNSTTLKAFPLLLPEYQEQQQILSFIDGETGHLSRAITDTEREITLLREYRTRLISDVVTGKLDVREVAKGLPEEALLNPLDDEPLYDGEETEDTSESDPANTPEE